jgi:hypothetical protein
MLGYIGVRTNLQPNIPNISNKLEYFCWQTNIPFYLQSNSNPKKCLSSPSSFI